MSKIFLFALLLALMSSIALQPSAQGAQKASYELLPSSRVILQISAGMTIDEIIAKIYPQHQHLWPEIKQKLIAWNPASFHQYSEKLVTGARLKLVDIKKIYEEELLPLVKVGYVARLQGVASAQNSDGRVQPLQINSQIYEGDRINTEVGSRLQVLMDDGAEVYLKGDSVLKITEYVITSGFGKDSSSILDLLRGGFRKITGAIGGSSFANYQVQTGLATIGIRGTEYVVKLCKVDDCTQTVSRNDPGAKLHAVVLEGSITLTTDEDVQILMAMGDYGTASTDVLQVEDDGVAVPAGFLNDEETDKFNLTMPQQQVEEKQPEESSSSAWKWIVGVLLIALAL